MRLSTLHVKTENTFWLLHQNLKNKIIYSDVNIKKWMPHPPKSSLMGSANSPISPKGKNNIKKNI